MQNNKDPIPQGQRNATMYAYAVRVIKRHGPTQEAANEYIKRSNDCVPPLEQGELTGIWNNAVGFYRRNILGTPGYVPPRGLEAPPPPEPPASRGRPGCRLLPPRLWKMRFTLWA